MQTGFEPLNTLKPVGEGLWLIDGPAEVYHRLPYPTRACVAQLADRSLWVHAPTVLTEALAAELAALGPVAHLVAPNETQTLHLEAWAEAYPEARIWRVGDLGQGEAWPDEVDHLIIGGAQSYREAAFFHRKAETLILAKLMVQLDTAKLPSWMRPFIWFASTDYPNGGMSPAMRRAYRDRDALADSIEAMIAWRPRRIVICHGEWVARDAVAELERTFRKVLRERLWVKAMDDIEARQRDP